MSLVYRFHKRGILRDVLLNTKSPKSSGLIPTDVADIKTDIYNYCARFDSVPIFTHQARRQGHRTSIEVKIVLPRQDICVIGQGTSYRLAETEAALRFKQEAEKYQAKHGQGSIVIKDSTSLTTSNSRKFVEFYRITHPKTQIRMNFTQSKSMTRFEDGLHQCQLFIDEKPIGEAAEAYTKKSAEPLAYLTAAVALKEREPQIFPKFIKAWKAGNGDILVPLVPITMLVDEESVFQMRQTLISARRAGLPDEPDELASEVDLETTRFSRHSYLTPMQAKKRDLSMQKAFGAYLQDPRLDKLRRTRSELPISQYSAKVLDLVKNSTYSIIVGATGCGKTTQVPQIILENAISNGEGSACNIICTQPRRIAATSVARRVSEERGEALQETVGYQVRFQARLPKARGSITFCTTGIILKQLQYSPDVIMDDVSHLIIDEVHERDINIDFLLVILKKIMRQRAAAGRSTPKVVLMSATIDTELFASYFQEITAEGVKVDCPALNVPGRTFPVKEIFLPDIVRDLKIAHSALALRIIEDDKASTDYLRANSSFLLDRSKTEGIATSHTAKDEELVIDWKQEKRYTSEGDLVNVSSQKDDGLVPYGLVAATVAHIANQSTEGAVLVFLPGIDDILKVDRLLRGKQTFGINFNDESKFRLHMLHSSLSGTQTEVFNPVPPGCRKIILSTNIAETSITIPDVQYVVDTGKLKEKQYDQTRRINELKCTWISKSNSKQRAGRAGRVQNGHYYALFPRERYDSMRPIGLPEMLRTDLQEICLDIKAQAFQSPIREFLASALEPPSPKAVDLSIRNLEALDAITPEEQITPLGRLLASLPVHPSLGKMIVLGVIFRCLDPMVVLGAAHSERELFLRPPNARDPAHQAKLSFAQGSASDCIAVLNAVRGMREEGQNGVYRQRDFAMRNYIHGSTYQTIENTARQIEGILVEAGIIQQDMPISPYRRYEHIGGPSLNQYSNKVPLIKALLLAGLHPNLAACKGGRTYRTPGEQTAMPHPSSANRVNSRDRGEVVPYGKLLSYSSMMRSIDDSATKLCDTTQSTPMMAVLFGGKISTTRNTIVMDEWLSFYVRSDDRMALKTILEFRKALERLLSMTFRRLTMKKKPEMLEQVSPADEIVRETFAQGLVDILDRDSGSHKPQTQWPTTVAGLEGLSDLTPTKRGLSSQWNGSTSNRIGQNARGYIR